MKTTKPLAVMSLYTPNNTLYSYLFSGGGSSASEFGKGSSGVGVDRGGDACE